MEQRGRSPGNGDAAWNLGEMVSAQAEKILFEDREIAQMDPRPFIRRRIEEQEYLGLVRLGYTHLLEQYLKSGSRTPVKSGTLSFDPLAQARYMAVVVTALACRAAMEGGVPEQVAYAFSDSYIQQIDRILDPGEIGRKTGEIMLGFCRAVQQFRLGDHSPAVRKCCEYMGLHLHGSLRLEQLGRLCGLSPNYISDLFRKEFGMGALQYFQMQKLMYAKHLLQTTEYSVSEIAAQLSYPSHSNFTQRFRRVYGITPAQFRRLRE